MGASEDGRAEAPAPGAVSSSSSSSSGDSAEAEEVRRSLPHCSLPHCSLPPCSLPPCSLPHCSLERPGSRAAIPAQSKLYGGSRRAAACKDEDRHDRDLGLGHCRVLCVGPSRADCFTPKFSSVHEKEFKRRIANCPLGNKL